VYDPMFSANLDLKYFNLQIPPSNTLYSSLDSQEGSLKVMSPLVEASFKPRKSALP
jgi:hypothetical protein